MTHFFGNKTNTPNAQRALSRLMMTSALVAAGTLVLSSSAMAAPWDDVTGVGFTNNAAGANTTNIVATTANGKASGTGNLDIGFGQKVNIDAKLFVARDNRDTVQTSILGNLNSNGTVVLIDRNGIVFGRTSVINVGSIIASTGDISDADALGNADNPLFFSNFGAGQIVNKGIINANGSVGDYGLVAFVAPTVKNDGIITARAGRIALAAGNETATVDLYGDGLVELAVSDKNDDLLSENTGALLAVGGKVHMTAAAVKDTVDSVVNMKGIATVNSVFMKDGKIVLSAKKVNVDKKAVVLGDTEINADVANLGTTILGDVTGSSKKVNVLSNKAKIAQGLGAVAAGGTVNVAAGTYNEHLVMGKAGVTLKGANAGISANGVRGAETIIVPNSPGVTITADNVTVDGLVFSGATGTDGYGIFVDGGDNATLTNNIINNNSQNGIYLLNSLGSTISGNAINNTGSHGIYALNSANTKILNNNIGTLGGVNNINGDGILIEKSSGTVVKGNTITKTKSTASQVGSGIHSLNSNNVTIGGALMSDRNIISQSEWDNIKISNGANILVENNDLDSATRVGVFALGVFNMTTRNNDIDGASMYGVRYSSVSGTSSILGNTIDTIGIDGINVLNSKVAITNNTIGYGTDGDLDTGDDTIIGNDGISIISSNSAQVSGNKVAHTTRNGIYVDGSAGVTLSANTIDFTGKSGMYLLNSTGAQILNNNIGTLGGNNNINGDGILIDKSSGAVVKGNTITETTSTASQVGSGIHSISSNNVIIGGPLLSDRNVISQSEWDNIKISNGANILVENNDLDSATRVGVFALGVFNMTTRNNDIDGAAMYGVRYSSVSGTSSIIGNTIDTIGIDGISLISSNKVGITNNTIGYGTDGNLNTADDSVIGNDGISIVSSNGTQAFGNKIAHTKRNGIYADTATGATFSGNTVNFTGKTGMYLLNTTGAQILDNKIGTVALNNNINGDGILVENSTGTVIKRNTITETTSTASKIGSGIHILNSENVMIGGAFADRNIISQSEWDNVKVTAGNNVTVEGNDLDTAKRVGVYSEYTNNMVALNNDIDGASMYGVKYMAVTGASSVVGNTIDTIGIDGINIYYSNNNVVTGNLIGYGTDRALGGGDDTVIKQDGISIFYSKGTQAIDNKIANSKRNGVYINGESNTTLSGNAIDSSGLDAVQIVNNKNTTVQNNLIGYGADGALGADDTTTARDGIRVDRSSGMNLAGNKIVNAGVNGVHVLNSSGLIQVNTNSINDSVANGILAVNAGAIDLRIVDNTIQNTGFLVAPVGSAAINLDISAAGAAKLSGNTLGDNFEYGLLGYSGTVDLTGATNTIQNTRVGIGFYPVDPATLALLGNTIGTTEFIDQADYFVDLGTGALMAPGNPTLIDGNNATYTLGGVTIDPFTAGGVTQAEYDLLQIMLNDYNDVQDRGLFFFNVFPQLTTLGTFDQKDVLREFAAPEIEVGNGSLRITALPRVTLAGPTPGTTAGGAGVVLASANTFDPNAIEPAAGDEAGQPADDVANIQPAAGESESACWSDATTSLGQGAPVTFNFGGGQDSLLQNAATCGTGGQAQSL